MLPLMHQACAETTGALWSSRTMTVRPFSKVMRRVPGGQAGMPAAAFLKATRLRETTNARIRNRAPRVRLQVMATQAETNATLVRLRDRLWGNARGQKRFAKRIVKIVAVSEILTA